MTGVTHLQTALTWLKVLIGQVEGLGTNHAIGVILMYCQQARASTPRCAHDDG